MINNCNTIDLCDIGPNVIVYPDNIIYRGVTVKDLPEIVESLRNDTVVERLALNANTPEEQARKAFYIDLLATTAPLTDDAVHQLVTRHEYDDTWLNEQMRRGFLAKKVDKETGDSFFQVTKKTRVRYSL
jgi:(2Fe-2S) ferredoxin